VAFRNAKFASRLLRRVRDFMSDSPIRWSLDGFSEASPSRRSRS
jgi:hypothetical protein